MADIAAGLNEIWKIFRAKGIVDDLLIIDHIATLLLEQNSLSPPSGLQGEPVLLPKVDEIKTRLSALSTLLEGGAAELFDRYILFRLDQTHLGGRYPTPRHLVKFMRTIAHVTANDSLLDLACGSGGMLAGRAQSAEHPTLTNGLEISPQWARLAWANCALHGLKDFTIEIADALTYPQAISVNRILMNPPFGTQVSTEGLSGRSETRLIEQAIKWLADNGRLCVLAPAGILFGGGREKELRKNLCTNQQINAIIALPKDTFQPFSTLQTYLLLITKSVPQAGTWFIRAERDGYMRGRGRDLTKQPTDASDFPLIESILGWDNTWNLTDDQQLLSYRQLTIDEERVLIIGAPAGSIFTQVERYSQGSKHIFLINVGLDAQRKSYIVDLNDPIPIKLMTQQREDIITEKFSKSKEEKPKLVTLLNGDHYSSAIAITTSGRLLGTRVLQDQIIKQADYTFKIDRYLPAEEMAVVNRPPSELLVEIRANQGRMAQYIDSLLRKLEAPQIGDGRLMAQVWQLEPTAIDVLSREQRQIWDSIKSLTLTVHSESASTGF